MSTTTPADPRLQPENITAALDAIGDALETLIAKGQTQPFHDAYGRFREAWPRPEGDTDAPIPAEHYPAQPPTPDATPPAGGGEPVQEQPPAPTG